MKRTTFVGIACLAAGSLLLILVPFRTAFAAPDTTEKAKAAPPIVGEKARDFELDSLGGKKIKLSSLAEKHSVVVVVLRGYPGYQCPLCLRQVGQFIKRTEDFRAANAQVIMVYPGPSSDLKKHAQEFVKGIDLPDSFHLVLDPDFRLTEAWHLRWNEPSETAYPSTFVVAKDLTIRFAKVSKSHGGRASVDDVIKAIK